MPDYLIDDYLNKKRNKKRNFEVRETRSGFQEVCEKVKEAFHKDWENRESSGINLEIQKRAIIGYEKEKNYYLDRISVLLKELEAFDTEYPLWYENLALAVYHENWGLAGLAQWFSPEYADSSSAKIVSDNIFFMENGRMRLMPQTISPVRKEQLIKAFLLLSPEERMDKDYYELYMLDGTRVTIFTEPMAKRGQSSIVFRRYVVPTISFE